MKNLPSNFQVIDSTIYYHRSPRKKSDSISCKFHKSYNQLNTKLWWLYTNDIFITKRIKIAIIWYSNFGKSISFGTLVKSLNICSEYFNFKYKLSLQMNFRLPWQHLVAHSSWGSKKHHHSIFSTLFWISRIY